MERSEMCMREGINLLTVLITFLVHFLYVFCS